MYFINVSNHPSTQWDARQLHAVSPFRKIVDESFPNIIPYSTERDLDDRATEFVMNLVSTYGKDSIVHIQGEMTFTYRVVTLLKELNITCVASTTERNTIDNEDGTKTVKFQFVKFRKY